MDYVIGHIKTKNALFSAAAGRRFILAALLVLGTAFAACGKSAGLPAGTEEVTPDTVKGIANVKSIFIPESVRYIDPAALYEMTELENITVSPDNPNYASGDGLLFNKVKTELTACPRGRAGICNVPEGVTDIGNDAFESCDKITAINIPASVKLIGIYSFDGCTRLSDINVNPDNSDYSSDNGVLLSKDKTELIACPLGKAGAYEVPEGVKLIAGRAFAGCKKLTSVALPKTVTLIGEEAFSGCIGLTGTFALPNSVSVIGKNAFDGCSPSLTVKQGGKEIPFKPAEN